MKRDYSVKSIDYIDNGRNSTRTHSLRKIITVICILGIVVSGTGFFYQNQPPTFIDAGFFTIDNRPIYIKEFDIKSAHPDLSTDVKMVVKSTKSMLINSLEIFLLNESQYLEYQNNNFSGFTSEFLYHRIFRANNLLTAILGGVYSQVKMVFKGNVHFYLIIKSLNGSSFSGNFYFRLHIANENYKLGTAMMFGGIMLILLPLIVYYKGYKRLYLIGLVFHLIPIFFRIWGFYPTSNFDLKIRMYDDFITPGGFIDFEYWYLGWMGVIKENGILSIYNTLPGFNFSPMFALILYLFYLIPIGSAWKVGLPIFLSNYLTGVFLNKILRLYRSERLANIITFFYFINPFIIFYGSYIWMNPPFFVFFTVWGTYLLLAEKEYGISFKRYTPKGNGTKGNGIEMDLRSGEVKENKSEKGTYFKISSEYIAFFLFGIAVMIKQIAAAVIPPIFVYYILHKYAESRNAGIKNSNTGNVSEGISKDGYSKNNGINGGADSLIPNSVNDNGIVGNRMVGKKSFKVLFLDIFGPLFKKETVKTLIVSIFFFLLPAIIVSLPYILYDYSSYLNRTLMQTTQFGITGYLSISKFNTPFTPVQFFVLIKFPDQINRFLAYVEVYWIWFVIFYFNALVQFWIKEGMIRGIIPGFSSRKGSYGKDVMDDRREVNGAGNDDGNVEEGNFTLNWPPDPSVRSISVLFYYLMMLIALSHMFYPRGTFKYYYVFLIPFIILYRGLSKTEDSQDWYPVFKTLFIELFYSLFLVLIYRFVFLALLAIWLLIIYKNEKEKNSYLFPKRPSKKRSKKNIGKKSEG